MKKDQTDNKNKGGQPQDTKPQKPKFNFYWIYGLLAVIFIGLQVMNWDTGAEQVDQGELMRMLRNQDVEKIDLVNREIAEIYMKTDTRRKYTDTEQPSSRMGTKPDFTFQIGSVDSFETIVRDSQEGHAEPIYVNNISRRNWGGEILGWIFPILILVGIWFFIMRMMSRGGAGPGGQIFNIGKSKAQLFDKNTQVNVTFKDVAGLEEAKVEIMEIVDFCETLTNIPSWVAKSLKVCCLLGLPELVKHC